MLKRLVSRVNVYATCTDFTIQPLLLFSYHLAEHLIVVSTTIHDGVQTLLVEGLCSESFLSKPPK